MTTKYSDYLKMPKSLSLDEMTAIHLEMLSEIGTDPDALEVYGDLLEASVRYAATRSEWLLLSISEKAERENSRTSLHNALLMKYNMLARCLKMLGRPATWRDALGYEEDDRINRKRAGDFACYLAFVYGLNAR